MAARHKEGAELFKTAGGFAPTIGIIGTVMGLVHVLQNLSAPETLGPSISGAFIATLMGVGAANVVFLPVATRLKGLSHCRAARAQPGARGHPLDPGRRQPARRVREAHEPRAARRAPLGGGGGEAEPAPRRCRRPPPPPRRRRSAMASSRAGAWAPSRRPRRATSAGCSTYADMITLLMALFMVLFSISSVNISKYVTLQRSLQDAFSGRILPGGRALQESGGDTHLAQGRRDAAEHEPCRHQRWRRQGRRQGRRRGRQGRAEGLQGAQGAASTPTSASTAWPAR